MAMAGDEETPGNVGEPTNILDFGLEGFGLHLGDSAPEQQMLHAITQARKLFEIPATLLGGRGVGASGDRDDAFSILTRAVAFQTDNMRNTREALVLHLASRIARRGAAATATATPVGSGGWMPPASGFEDAAGLGLADAAQELSALRAALLRSYSDWARFTGARLRAAGMPPPGSDHDKRALSAAYERRREPRRFFGGAGGEPGGDDAEVCGERTAAAFFGGDARAARDAASDAIAVALVSLIWGEAANLRFCPECLSFIYHRLLDRIISVLGECGGDRVSPLGTAPAPFLKDIITPHFKRLEAESKKKGLPELRVNYDDYNEAFWSGRHLPGADNIGGDPRAEKSFVESRSYLASFRNFSRIVYLLSCSLHALVQIARTRHEDSIQSRAVALLPVAVTLSVAVLLREFAEVMLGAPKSHFPKSPVVARAPRSHNAAAAHDIAEPLVPPGRAQQRRTAATIAVNAPLGYRGTILLRALFKLSATTALCYAAIPGSALSSSYHALCGLYLVCACVAEVATTMHPFSIIMRRCAPASLCVFFGVEAWTTLTARHCERRNRYGYSGMFFWLLVLGAKFSFSYFLQVRPAVEFTAELFTNSTAALLDDDSNDLVSSVWDYTIGTHTFHDSMRLTLLAPVWLTLAAFYIYDLEIWYTLALAVVGGIVGVLRHVGEIRGDAAIATGFSALPAAFGALLRRRQHGTIEVGAGAPAAARKKTDEEWFALLWNEVVSSLREGDLISNGERSALEYWVSHGVALSDATLVLPPAFLKRGRLHVMIQKFSYFEDNQPSAQVIDEQTRFLAKRGLDRLRDYPAVELLTLITMVCHELFGHDELRPLANQYPLAVAMRSLPDALLAAKQALELRLSDDGVFLVQLSSLVTFVRFSRLRSLVEALREFCLSLRTTQPVIQSQRTDEISRTKALNDVFTTLVKFLDAITGLQEGMPGDGSEDANTLFVATGGAPSLADALRTARSQLDGTPSLKVQIAEAVSRAWRACNETLVELEAKLDAMLSPSLSLQDSVQSNEARRRLTTFVDSVNAMLGTPPNADGGGGVLPPVATARSWGTLTPYYNETVLFSVSELVAPTEEGVTTLEYLRTIYPEEFAHFLERCILSASRGGLGAAQADLCHLEKVLLYDSGIDAAVAIDMDGGDHEISMIKERLVQSGVLLALQWWASERGQTLARTVRGQFNFERAIKTRLKLELEVLNGRGPLSGESPAMRLAIDKVSRIMDENQNASEDETAARVQSSLKLSNAVHANLFISRAKEFSEFQKQWRLRTDSFAAIKYTYVVSCQIYGQMRAGKDVMKADEIDSLLRTYRNLRVAYVDVVGGNNFSVLIRACGSDGAIKEVYRIALPGNFRLGEAKPNNQNHAVVFSRGEALQAIDMNQDCAFEEALKIDAVLEGFDDSVGSHGRIIGMREHVFTHNVSSLAHFMSAQETVFVTTTQRALECPLSMRFHYGNMLAALAGHPDLFDKVSAMTLGGVSKASTPVNLSEDIFAGFNWHSRGGLSTQSDVVEAGKGRDVGFAQICIFTSKVSKGNAEQTLSRDVARLASTLSMPQLLSFFYSSVGHYLGQVFILLNAYVFVYCKIFLCFTLANQKLATLASESSVGKELYDSLFSSQVFQLFVLVIIAQLVARASEVGFISALKDICEMFLRGSLFFYGFLVGQKGYHVHTTLCFGGAGYQGTGRGFVINHETLCETWRRFFFSHWVIGCEFLFLALIYGWTAEFVFHSYVVEMLPVLLLIASFVWAPFFFNPNGFDFTTVCRDWAKWWTWMFAESDTADMSWVAWWAAEHKAIESASFCTKFITISLPNARFLFVGWGLALQFKKDGSAESSGIMRRFFTQDISKPFCAMLAILVILVVYFKVVVLVRFDQRALSKKRGFVPRSCTAGIARRLGVGAAGTGAAALLLTMMWTVGIGASATAFGSVCFFIHGSVSMMLPFGLLGRGKPLFKYRLVQWLERVVHLNCGVCIFAPVLLVSVFGFMADLHTRCLFNVSFAERLGISKLFARQQQRAKQLAI